jgi:hypothetical protein
MQMLKAGTLSDFGGSMAEAIDVEFVKLWNIRHKYPLPESSKPDRHALFIAIAQGIINYLRDNAPDSIKVTVSVEQISGSTLIASGGTAFGSQDAATAHTHSVRVNQLALTDVQSPNKVLSEGQGTVQILVDGLD